MTAPSPTARAIARLRSFRRTQEGRDTLVREASDVGLTPTQIADLSGLARQTVYTILNAARATEPTEEQS